jgi:hypothetical protein
MLLTKKFIANAVSGVISPHGMTDYIHAKKFGFLNELYRIHLSMAVGGFVLNHCQLHIIIQSTFLIASIVHFRNDMPLIEIKNTNSKWLQLLFSTVFVGSLHFVPIEYFVLYMLFIHTPNHYRLAWNYIKDNLEETACLVIGVGAMMSQFNNIDNIPLNLIAFIQTLVISHIVYQEKYVFSEYRQLLDKFKRGKKI